ncbi:PcfJ domain-containing protein [uncultured Treponema sp.]|uniref:PcfJ domain-containing protein n=1 Tax=uncultured Treponema sp. TaxID=162155 RepID=UPI00263A3003|nr:PcfJ domain-containing protein [uncultured Treponema sp.]
MRTQCSYWAFSPKINKYIPISCEPMSLFPTIVNLKQKSVYCRSCHRWEYIAAFSNNILKSQCGHLYEGPFAYENSIFNYGYHVAKTKNNYLILVKSQTVVKQNRRLIENFYELNLERKVLSKNGKSVFESEDLAAGLCPEITEEILKDLGDRYKKEFGIVPTIASKFRGFSLIIGYMLSPFNINFYKISHHWALNPYDKDFSTLSSGNTPTAENEMFHSLGIKPSKSVRKLYQSFPEGVISYAAVKDLGFSDVNILLKSANPLCYAFFKFCMVNFSDGEISYSIRPSLKKFVGDMLAVSSEKTVWNSLERTFNFFADEKIPDNVIIDGINSYPICADALSDKEKKDVLHEGFNDYTHDFLVRRADIVQAQNANALSARMFDENQEKDEKFEIEQPHLDLAYKCGENRTTIRTGDGKIETVEVKDEDRYCFYVAQSSAELRTVGSEMHNCVGWCYTELARKKYCTIVYAKYKNKYRICIEVSPKFSIRQALGPGNRVLQGEDLLAYQEWCRAKNIKFKKVF